MAKKFQLSRGARIDFVGHAGPQGTPGTVTSHVHEDGPVSYRIIWDDGNTDMPVCLESDLALLDGLRYVVCDRLLDPETNEHCEFDGRVHVTQKQTWLCPGCHAMRSGISE